MKQILKTLGKTVAIVVVVFAFASFAMDAWDNTMTDAEIIQYLETYPNEIKLQKLAEKRGLTKNGEIVYYDGHCDFENEDYQRGQEIFDYAMMIYDKNDGNVDFEDCLRIAEEVK